MISSSSPVNATEVGRVWKAFCVSRGWGLALAGLEEKAKNSVGDALFPSRARIREKPDPNSPTDGKQGEGIVRNCSWQLELPRERIPHHGMCKAPEQTAARAWLCEKLGMDPSNLLLLQVSDRGQAR